MSKKIFTLLALALISLSSLAQEQTTPKKSLYQGYSGGMMVHLGYGYGGTLTPTGYNSTINVDGISSGIGGRIVIKLGSHLRVGTEGYVSTINYGENRKSSIGWGGLTADYGWQIGKFRPYFGLSLGFGSYENQASIETPLNNNTPQATVWNTYGVFLAVPYAAVEYNLTSKIALCARLDWITSPTVHTTTFTDFSSGPRLHIGFMFSH